MLCMSQFKLEKVRKCFYSVKDIVPEMDQRLQIVRDVF